MLESDRGRAGEPPLDEDSASFRGSTSTSSSHLGAEDLESETGLRGSRFPFNLAKESEICHFPTNGRRTAELCEHMVDYESIDGARDAGALLEELDWLHGLARRLVRDPNSAEDLVQETWLAALARFGRESLPPRDWLLSRLRSQAWNRRRADRRRSQRERSRGAPLSESSASELVLRSEAQGLLLQAVLGLEPALRDALLMRFSAGLSVTEIAARQACAKSTVSQRLQRGLAELRQRLNDQDGGRPWSSCLAFAALPASPKFTGQAGLWSLLLMSKSYTLLGACALLAVLATLAFVGLDALRGTPQSKSAPIAMMPSGASSLDEEQAEANTNSTPAAAEERLLIAQEVEPLAQASPRDYRLLGELEREDGSGFEAVLIRMMDGAQERARTLSDGTGRFELRLSPTQLEELGSPKMLEAWIEAPTDHGRRVFGFSDTESADFPLPRLSSTDDLGRITLQAGSGFEGRVVDRDETPIQGAKISLQVPDPDQDDGRSGYYGQAGSLECETDEAGRYQLLGMPAGPYFVAVRHKDFEAPNEPHATTCAIGERTQVADIVLDRAELLPGTVFDTSGAPLEGAYISCGRASRRSLVRSRADGSFELPLRSGRPVQVNAVAIGHKLLSPDLEEALPNSVKELEIIMQKREVRSVFELRNATTGEAVTSAAYALREYREGDPYPDLQFTILGRAQLLEAGLLETGARDGEHLLVIDAPGYRRSVVPVVHQSSVAPHQIVELKAVEAIVGRVLRQQRVVPGARVRLYRGDFRLNAPRLELRHGELVRPEVERFLPSTLGYDSYSLKGVVGLDGTPPPYRYVRWGRVLAATRTDEAGRFRLPNDKSEPLFISVEDEAPRPVIFNVEPGAGQVGADLGDLQLGDVAQLSGQLVLPEHVDGSLFKAVVEDLELEVPISPDGQFELTDLPPGDLYIEINEVEYEDQPRLSQDPSFHLRLAAGEIRQVTLPIESWLSCELSVPITLNGQPAPKGVRLYMRPVDSNLEFDSGSGLTDESGILRGHQPAQGLCELKVQVRNTRAWPTLLPVRDQYIDLVAGQVIDTPIDVAHGRVILDLARPADSSGPYYVDLQLLDPTTGDLLQETRHIELRSSELAAADEGAGQPGRWRSGALNVLVGPCRVRLLEHRKPFIEQRPELEVLEIDFPAVSTTTLEF